MYIGIKFIKICKEPNLNLSLIYSMLCCVKQTDNMNSLMDY